MQFEVSEPLGPGAGPVVAQLNVADGLQPTSEHVVLQRDTPELFRAVAELAIADFRGPDRLQTVAEHVVLKLDARHSGLHSEGATKTESAGRVWCHTRFGQTGHTEGIAKGFTIPSHAAARTHAPRPVDGVLETDAAPTHQERPPVRGER